MNYNKLWRALLYGDKEALSEIYLAYHDDLFRYGFKLSGNQEMVKDCIQELFLKLWKNHNNLKPIKNIKPYLFKSLRNHIIDSIELKRQNAAMSSENEPDFIVSYANEDFKSNEQVPEETRLKVIEALNQLTPRQKEIIYLRYFEELDFNTISQIMSINVQSVRNIIHRGMKVLRDLMLIQPFFFLISRNFFTVAEII